MSTPATPAPFILDHDALGWLARQPQAKRGKYYRAIGEVEWTRCADDVFYWLDAARHLMPYVYTKDEKPMYTCTLCQNTATYFFNDRSRHMKLRHDIHAEVEQDLRNYFRELDTTRVFTLMPYFRPIIEAWLREKIIFVEKSRDMMMTWLMIALYSWDTFYHRGRQNIFQSEDAAKTLKLVQRADFIYRNQPKFLRDRQPVVFSSGSQRSGNIDVPGLESEIMGFPMGPDQIRMFHPSGIFADEAAYQAKAGDAFMASKPAIQAGGRYTAVSSANPSFFMAACRDLLETTGVGA